MKLTGVDLFHDQGALFDLDGREYRGLQCQRMKKIENMSVLNDFYDFSAEECKETLAW